MEIACAFQNTNNVSDEVSAGRNKSWGVGQAVLAAKDLLHEPFLDINIDD